MASCSVVYANPTDAEADAFLKITDDAANRPMFIHCTAAIRVGAFWAIRRALRDGLTTDAALEEGRKVGLVNAPHLEEFARNLHRVPPAAKVSAQTHGTQPMARSAACPTVAALGRRRAGVTLAAAVLAAAGISSACGRSRAESGAGPLVC